MVDYSDTERLVDLKIRLREIAQEIEEINDSDGDSALAVLTAERKSIEAEIKTQQKILALQVPTSEPVLWLADPY